MICYNAIMPHAGVKWIVVAPVYLKQPVSSQDLDFWKRFFTKLGVKQGLHVARTDEYLAEVLPLFTYV